MFYTLYQTTNLITSKIYIGVHQTKDKYDNYLGSGVYLNNSILKYGKENFKKEIIFEAKSKEIMYWVESWIVDKEFIERKNTYNLKIGGFGGFDNKINAKDKNNKIIRISKEEFKNSEFVGIAKDTVVVKDRYNNKFRVSIIDSRYLSDEFVAVSKGRKASVEEKHKKSELVSRENNPKAKLIQIFNSNNNLILTTNGNFKKMCEINNFPFAALRKSLQKGHKIYTKQPWQTPEKYKNFIGWYAKEIMI